MKSMLFWIEIIFIALAAAVDNYLLIRYVTISDELNPLGVYLLKQGGIPLFSASKMFGTTLAVAIMILLYYRYHRMGIIVTHAIAISMLVLLWFLLT